MQKKKRPLIERDVPPHSPAGLATLIENYLRNATQGEMKVMKYEITLDNGITFTWSVGNERAVAKNTG